MNHPVNYGQIWTDSKLTARKARNEYVCETPDCRATIHKGETYYAEFRGGIDSIRRCPVCVGWASGLRYAQEGRT